MQSSKQKDGDQETEEIIFGEVTDPIDELPGCLVRKKDGPYSILSGTVHSIYKLAPRCCSGRERRHSSTASLVVGVAASHATHTAVLVAGVAGLVAGAMSMAAGEYVSVSSQLDTERADIERERTELAGNGDYERKELAAIYVKRGLELSLADQVAEQLMAKNALAAHARDELGISETIGARPVQAALTSAITFAVGAALPLLVVVIAPAIGLGLLVAGTSLFFLALLGGLAAYTGGAPILKGILRVTFWGTLAMAITAGIGALFGTTV